MLVAPALLFAYWLVLRRRRKQAVRYSSVALLRSVLPKRNRWQRHLPIAMLLASIVALALAAGRPQVERDVPYARTSVILALDVSGSMCSTDVEPNRLAVAQDAAREFVKRQPKSVRMGLVVFSGFAELAVPPTTDHEALTAAIDSLTTGRGTAIGAAMLKGIDAIAEINPGVTPVGELPTPAAHRRRRHPGRKATCPTSSFSSPTERATGASNLAKRSRTRSSEASGSSRSASGRPARRLSPARASSSAGTRSIPTGSAEGAEAGSEGAAVSGAGFRTALIADVPTLQAIASETGGTFHGAKDADQLSRVFADLPKSVATQKKATEVTWILAALGAVLLAAVPSPLRSAGAHIHSRLGALARTYPLSHASP